MPTAKKKPAWRVENDSLGEVRVPADALWGAQTQRAVENFPVSGLRAHPAFIRSYVLVKRAAALTNFELGVLDRRRARAIASACDALLGGDPLPFSTARRSRAGRTSASVAETRRRSRPIVDDDIRSVPFRVPPKYIASEYLDQFVVDVFQAGAGTSFNMNCNEVIANLANDALGAKPGLYDPIHPNDHVNMSQSTNDTFPTAMRISTLLLLRELFPSLDGLAFTFDAKGEETADIMKPGRTHLQDAVPVTLGQEFRGYCGAVRRATRLLVDAADELRDLGLGGTATGTGLNTPIGYRWSAIGHLAEMTGLELSSSEDLRESMQSQLPIAAVSSALRNLALELGRISNDLRLMASGPHNGLGEILLPAVQPGSSIMPGKVNPSMLECMNQICFHIVGADAAIAMAVQAGQLELNVMMPLMAFELLFSIDALKNFLPGYTERCIAGITANLERCERDVQRSPALATVLNPLIGYERAAEIAKESVRTGRTIPEILRERGLFSEDEIAAFFSASFLTGQAERQS